MRQAENKYFIFLITINAPDFLNQGIGRLLLFEKYESNNAKELVFLYH